MEASLLPLETSSLPMDPIMALRYAICDVRSIEGKIKGYTQMSELLFACLTQINIQIQIILHPEEGSLG